MTAAPVGKFQPPKKASFASYFTKQKTTTYPDPPIRSATSSTSIVRCLSWSPLGNLIATGVGGAAGGSPSILRVWNPERTSVKTSTELRGHAGTIDRVAWNPEKEAELASCGADGVIRFWDVRSKSSIGSVKFGGGPGGEGINMAWKPDGSEIIVGRKVEDQDDYICRIDRATLTEISQHREDRQTNQPAFSWSGKELLLTTGDGSVKILDYPSMEPLHTLNAHTSACYSIEVAASGAYVAIGGSDALITLWDTADWVCRRTFDRCDGLVRSLSFSCDGSYIVGGSDEGKGLEIAHVESGDYVYRIETSWTVPIVAWSPKDYSLAYAFGEGPGGMKIVGSFGLS